MAFTYTAHSTLSEINSSLTSISKMESSTKDWTSTTATATTDMPFVNVHWDMSRGPHVLFAVHLAVTIPPGRKLPSSWEQGRSARELTGVSRKMKDGGQAEWNYIHKHNFMNKVTILDDKCQLCAAYFIVACQSVHMQMYIDPYPVSQSWDTVIIHWSGSLSTTISIISNLTWQ